MQNRNLKVVVFSLLVGFLSSSALHLTYSIYNFGEVKIDKPHNKELDPAKKDEDAHYLTDNAPLSDNTYVGETKVREELMATIKLYNEVRNFQAFDYSNAQTKWDIFPDYKNFIEIEYATESGGLKGDSSTKYIVKGKDILMTYSTVKDGKLFLDAGFLATFLDAPNLKIFKKDLGSKGMDLKSFISARIEHGSHTFDNMDPNYFSTLAYINRMRSELDTLNYENITKIDSTTYELTNTNLKELPLMIGFPVIRFKSILKFTSANSFTLERRANKLTYIKVEFHTRPTFVPMKLPTADIDELDYNDNFVSPDISM